MRRLTGLALLAVLVVVATPIPGVTAAPSTALGVSSAAPPAGISCGVRAGGLPDDGGPVAAPEIDVTGLHPSALVMQGGRWFVLDGRTAVRVYDSGWRPIVVIPLAASSDGLGVDPDGNVWTSKYPFTVEKRNPAGAVVASLTLPQEVDGLFGAGEGPSWRLFVHRRSVDGLAVVDGTARLVGTSPIVGALGSPGPAGTLTTADGRYVYRWTSDGHRTLMVGDTHVANDPMPSGAPLHFYLQGSGVTDGEGTTYVPDATSGIHVIAADGSLLGTAPETAVGGLTERSPAVLAAGRLYFASGPRFTGKQSLVSLALADVRRLAARSTVPRLGFGAGLVSDGADHYAAAGRGDVVRVVFDPSWATRPGGLLLRTAVRGWRDTLAGAPGTVTEVPLTADLIPHGLAVPVSGGPGPSEVDARLLHPGGEEVGATCLKLATGAPGDTLDLAALPPGADAGGPGPARAVALADVLGTGLARVQLDWHQMLAGPGGLTTAAYDAPLAAAAAEAARRGVALEVQVGQGGPERALVDSGQWESRVEELVRHFSDRVHVWEAWNEPNNTYGTPADFTRKILAPFYRAVKRADPGATVVGGSVLGMDLAYWQGLVGSGALGSLDVAAIHPYTGHNRSFEEQGVPAALAALRELFARSGRPTLPIWDTESAWWSDGPYNWLSSPDSSVRARVWFRSLGVERWGYFVPEGSFGTNGISFSAIQVADTVKPVALALMAARTELADRPAIGPVTVVAPHVYAARFGSSPAARDEVVALFTDGERLPVAVAASRGTSVSDHDEYGGVSSWTAGALPAAVTALPSVQWLHIPAGTPLSVVPVESFGPNELLRGRATASSSAPHDPPSAAVDGDDTAANHGDWNAIPAWASGVGDPQPELTVRLASPRVIDRVVVSSHSLGSVISGIREARVQLRSAGGDWTDVGAVSGAFFTRNSVVAFPARTATDVRVKVQSVNYGGYAAGARPPFWPRDPANLTDPSAAWYGPAIIDELAAFAPGQVVTTEPPGDAGAPLPPGDPAGPGTGLLPAAPPARPAFPSPATSELTRSDPSARATHGRPLITGWVGRLSVALAALLLASLGVGHVRAVRRPSHRP